MKASLLSKVALTKSDFASTTVQKLKLFTSQFARCPLSVGSNFDNFVSNPAVSFSRLEMNKKISLDFNTRPSNRFAFKQIGPFMVDVLL